MRDAQASFVLCDGVPAALVIHQDLACDIAIALEEREERHGLRRHQWRWVLMSEVLAVTLGGPAPGERGGRV